MSSEKGFVTVCTLSLLPIVLVLVALASSVAISRLEYSKKMHACREGLLEVQQDVAKTVNRLIALNPLAKQLRIQRRISDEAVRLKLETVPYVNIAVGAHRAATILAQYNLKARQDYLRTSILYRSNRKIFEIRSEMTRLRDNLHDQKSVVIVPTLKLALRRTPEDSLTPDYNPIENFEHVQSLKIKFYFDPSYYVERLTHLALLQKNSQKTGRVQQSATTFWSECTVRLEKEEDNRWYPKIGAAKF